MLEPVLPTGQSAEDENDRTAARAQAYPDLRMLVLPHPMESRPEPEVRALAAARFAELVALLAESV